jgi:hypothetical protein
MKFDNYPIRIVVFSNLISFAIYGIGFLIILKFNFIFALIYLLYIIILEVRLIKSHCPDCFYWGKICGFGKGKLCSWFFKKGHNAKFSSTKITWKSMIPDFLVCLIPVIVGIVMIILNFNFFLLGAVIIILILTSVGNGIVRGKMVCKYCQQREIGCPADLLFNKK